MAEKLIVHDRKSVGLKTIKPPSAPPQKQTNVQQYLNPLTLEAEIFLNALNSFNISEIDPILLGTLRKVTLAIDKFIDKKLSKIVPNQNLKLISIEELSAFKHIYYCKTCNVTVGSSPGVCEHLLNGHYNLGNGKEAPKNPNELKKKKRTRPKKRNKNIQEIPPKAKSLFLSNLQIFRNESLLVAEKLKQIPDYDMIENDLMVLIKPLFPNKIVKIYIFGSRVSGLANCNSDLDIFVDIDNSFEVFEHRASITVLKKMRAVIARLKVTKKQWLQPTAIENTRVPIIKILHIQSRIDCDIGFSNALGYCNTKLVCYIFQLQPVARGACLFLKRWRDRCKFNDISSYAISLMVIYYLQILEKLPAIDVLQPSDDYTTVGPWKSNFLELTLDNFGMMALEDNFRQWRTFLQGFFQYYGKFDFENNVICPILGRVVNIKTFDVDMPERYKTWVENESNPGMEKTSIMVQDPIQLNHNITKNITPAKLKILKRYFELSATQMSNIL